MYIFPNILFFISSISYSISSISSSQNLISSSTSDSITGGSCLWSPTNIIFFPLSIGNNSSGGVALLDSSIITTSKSLYSDANFLDPD